MLTRSSLSTILVFLFLLEKTCRRRERKRDKIGDIEISGAILLLLLLLLFPLFLPLGLQVVLRLLLLLYSFMLTLTRDKECGRERKKERKGARGDWKLQRE